MSKKKMSCRATKKIGKTTKPDVIIDCHTLSKMQLRQRYNHEANTHRNMLSRQKSHGALIHPDFREFASFLRQVGPIPALGATIDRIDNADPEYAPGKVRWADKRTQNNNKSDTLLFYYSHTRESYTASRLAKLQGIDPGSIRQRKQRGWSDDEIIEGRRFTPPPQQAQHHYQEPRHRVSRSRSPSQISPSPWARDIMFQRMAERYKAMREDGDPEEVMATYEFLVEEIPEYFSSVTREQYERHFAKRWPQHRPHVIFDRLPVVQQELIRKIDPEYVAAVSAKEGFQSAVKDKL
ncbi:hypothetical protein FJ941_25535 [Mesorhizobium sp. B2-3-13]|uniref:hypothetical protein n=1 Tax=Mesorhizobium sp. B2-3-13 TaxID=2589951 RepID=UPI00112BAE86|nr:hypothetical protein [Mesorhizobium sp. B2-3-13]TPL76240.1 hypothetical protein FJ941_25535 [Mesorhizobium sp. B2-3-13]